MEPVSLPKLEIGPHLGQRPPEIVNLRVYSLAVQMWLQLSIYCRFR
jgi:hypothetical protein